MSGPKVGDAAPDFTLAGTGGTPEGPRLLAVRVPRAGRWCWRSTRRQHAGVHPPAQQLLADIDAVPRARRHGAGHQPPGRREPRRLRREPGRASRSRCSPTPTRRSASATASSARWASTGGRSSSSTARGIVRYAHRTLAGLSSAPPTSWWRRCRRRGPGRPSCAEGSTRAGGRPASVRTHVRARHRPGSVALRLRLRRARRPPAPRPWRPASCAPTRALDVAPPAGGPPGRAPGAARRAPARRGGRRAGVLPGQRPHRHPRRPGERAGAGRGGARPAARSSSTRPTRSSRRSPASARPTRSRSSAWSRPCSASPADCARSTWPTRWPWRCATSPTRRCAPGAAAAAAGAAAPWGRRGDRLAAGPAARPRRRRGAGRGGRRRLRRGRVAADRWWRSATWATRCSSGSTTTSARTRSPSTASPPATRGRLLRGAPRRPRRRPGARARHPVGAHAADAGRFLPDGDLDGAVPGARVSARRRRPGCSSS